MKTRSKITTYIIHSIAAMLVLSAQVSLAGSATWLASPQDSAWENPNNWTLGRPPNGSSDTATFSHSSQKHVNISTSVEVNSIVFTSNSDSFDFSITGSELVLSGTGIRSSGYAPRDDRESAMIAILPPGNYTRIVRGIGNVTGVALVDVYDNDVDRNTVLGNISTRSFVQTGADVMIGGFIVEGNGLKRVNCACNWCRAHTARCSECVG